MKLPYSLLKLPYVATIESGDEMGSDYKYEAGLIDGWCFSEGRLATCQWGFFNNIQDFYDACPIPRKDYVE